MSIGQIFDRALRLFTAQPLTMIGIAAISVIPAGLLNTVQPMVLESNPGLALGLSLLSLVITVVLGALVAGALTYLVAESFLGRSVSASEALARIKPRIGTLLGAQIVASLFISLGMLLFVVPGVIFALGYAVMVPAIVVEGLGAKAGRLRSWELLDGLKGRVFLAYLGMGLVFSVPALLSALILGQSPAGAALTSVLGLVSAPIGSTIGVLLYYDARLRKESFDLQMLSSAFLRKS